MNHDIQLSKNGGGGGNGHLPGVTGIDPLGQPTLPALQMSSEATPLKKLHRVLRGRYWIAITLCLVFAALGALVGWVSQVRSYTSVGQIEVQPVLFSFKDVDSVMPFAGQFVGKQVQLLQEPRVLEAVVESAEWKKHRPNMDRNERLADLIQHLVVSRVKDTFFIQVAYTDPQAEVATAAVNGIIKQYMTRHGEGGLASIDTKVKVYTDDERRLTSEINGLRAKLDRLEQKYALTQVDVLIASKTPDLPQVEKMVREAEFALLNAEEATKALPQGEQRNQPEAITPDVLANIAANDTTMQNLMRERSQREIDVKRLLRRYGPNHKSVTEAQAELADAEATVQTYAADFFKYNRGIKFLPDGSGSTPLTEAELNQLRARVDQIKKTRDHLNSEIAELARHKADLQTVSRDIARAEEERARVQKDIQQFTTQQQLSGHIAVISEGSRPVIPSKDNRTKVAFFGLLAGGGLPLGIVVLLGLTNTRYRYSDEANADLGGTTLLGILPDLPDRLSDPEQASVAAHCVHQIRTMMQINSGGPGQQTYAVTSAEPGDGKTSLTLALGLSYAACGSRVLLVDCDLIGGGLTARLNINSSDGVLEAIANRGLLEYVRNTDIADVAILPVGTNGQHHASTLSPQALRRLISDAKRHFDVVLIDTGPVLGSIEASLVCAAVDGVVLTVARGKQRQLVERSLQHLRGIGTRLVGVVFNRAQGSDFASSLSGMSVSLRSQKRHSGGQFGPVARAVASSDKAPAQG